MSYSHVVLLSSRHPNMFSVLKKKNRQHENLQKCTIAIHLIAISPTRRCFPFLFMFSFSFPAILPLHVFFFLFSWFVFFVLRGVSFSTQFSAQSLGDYMCHSAQCTDHTVSRGSADAPDRGPRPWGRGSGPATRPSRHSRNTHSAHTAQPQVPMYHACKQLKQSRQCG